MTRRQTDRRTLNKWTKSNSKDIPQRPTWDWLAGLGKECPGSDVHKWLCILCGRGCIIALAGFLDKLRTGL